MHICSARSLYNYYSHTDENVKCSKHNLLYCVYVTNHAVFRCTNDCLAGLQCYCARV